MAASYTSYLEHINNASLLKNDAGYAILPNFHAQYKQTAYASSGLFHSFYAIDYTKKKHLLFPGCVQKKMGYFPEDFSDGGLDFIVDISKNEDFDIYNKFVFPQVIKFLADIPDEQHCDYIFSCNYRLTNKDGSHIALLQKGGYITVNGRPVFGFGNVTDITPFKKDTSIIQTIERYKRSANGIEYENILTNFFYPNSEDCMLTSREKEILLWLSDGLSVKQIVDKVGATINTISNHRKNMFRKTNTKNIAELVNYAIKRGIL